MLPAPGQECLFGRLGPWRHDNEGDRSLFLATFWGWRDACVGDRRVAEQNPLHVARVLCALQRSGSPATVSVDPGYGGPLGDVTHVRASADAFAAELVSRPPARVRAVGSVVVPGALPAATYVDRRAVVLSGRIELARYLREQAVSRTLHRFGNIVGHRGHVDGFGMEPPADG